MIDNHSLVKALQAALDSLEYVEDHHPGLSGYGVRQDLIRQIETLLGGMTMDDDDPDDLDPYMDLAGFIRHKALDLAVDVAVDGELIALTLQRAQAFADFLTGPATITAEPARDKPRYVG